jgi:hypothetical protein
MSQRGNGMIHDDGERRGPGRQGRRRQGTRRVLRPVRRPAAQRIRSLIGLVAGLTLLVGAPVLALAALSPKPDGGVAGPQPYRVRDYERLHEGHYIADNDDFGSCTCLETRDQQRAANFTVTRQAQGNERIGAFPNIFADWEYGRHSARSWDLIADDMDGSSEAYVNFTNIPGGDYNAAGDIWFNRTYPSHSSIVGRDDGAEVTIWPVNHTFFHDEATALGDLNPHWYMTSVGFGYEPASGHFDGLTVKDFAVSYVSVPGLGLDPHELCQPGPKQGFPRRQPQRIKSQPSPEPKQGRATTPS